MRQPTRLLAAAAALLALWCAAPAPAQNVALIPNIRAQFVDGNGAPLAGGCVFFYTAGTTTPAPVYVDSTGTVQLPNPVILDTWGSNTIWLAQQGYKVSLWTAGGTNCSLGTQVWTVDNVTAFPSGGGGGGGGMTPTFTNITSAAVNPATAGFVRMGANDLLCWRNTANSGNLCLTHDTGDNLEWNSSFALSELGAAPSGLLGFDTLFGNGPLHRLGFVNNAGTPDQVVGAATADTFTNKYFDTGGTGNSFYFAGVQVTGVTGTGFGVLQTAPALLEPTTDTLSASGQITSTLATGMAPLVVASTTPIPNLTASNHPTVVYCGTVAGCVPIQEAGTQIVYGSVATSTSGGATVSGISPPFTSTATYKCVLTHSTTSNELIYGASNVSGSSFTINSQNTIADVVSYVCIGY